MENFSEQFSKEKELYLIRKALERIAICLDLIVNEGITIYNHENGPETHN